MNVIGYTESGSIRVEIDGEQLFVPDDMANRHRQLRLGLLANGITTAEVEVAIAAIPDPMDRSIAEVEWADASTYERDHHLIEMVGSALGLTAEQIDTMWEAALSLQGQNRLGRIRLSLPLPSRNPPAGNGGRALGASRNANGDGQ